MGLPPVIILHEYDHIEGKLFIDYIKPLKRTLLKENYLISARARSAWIIE
jgi:peptide deformylase